MSSEPGDTDPRSHSLQALARTVGAPLLIQFVKFGIVGVSNTLLTFVVYTLLLKVFGVWYLAASAIGFAVGTINSFLLNRRWTFRGHVGDALTPLRWTVVQCGGLGVNEGLLYVFVHDARVDKLLSQAFATAVVTITTFLANRAWTFRTHTPLPAVDGDV
ncbi:MAG: GtrA family protein [Actinobacteria bacterium]|nr:MAG: GtrA family protein [Actinomycetota bacterium]